MDKNLRLLVRLDALDKASRPMRGLHKQTAAANEAIKEIDGRLKALKATSADISAYRAQQAAIVRSTTKMEDQRAKIAALRDELIATDGPVKRLSASYEKATSVMDRMKRELDGQQRELQGMKTKLDAAGVSTAALARHEEMLRQSMAGANREIDEQKAKLAALGAQQSRIDGVRASAGRTQQMAGTAAGAGAGAIGAGLAIAAPLERSRAAAAELEQQVITIAQRSDMSVAAMGRFESQMLASGRAANRTREESLALFDELTAQGFKAQEALRMATAAGRAATAYRLLDADVASTAGSMRNVKVEAAQVGRAFDIMSVAGKRGAFEMDAMARSFPSLTASAAGLDMTGLKAVAELSAAAQVARKGAGSDEEAATNLSNLMQKISSPETARRFAKMGIDLAAGLAAGKAAGKSALETIIELTDKATGGDMSKLGYLFEDAQVQKAMRPLIAGIDEFRSIRDEALAGDGVVDRDFQRRMLANAEATKRAGIAAEAASIQIGKDLMPLQTQLAKTLEGVSNAYLGWAKANPEVAATLTTIVASAAGVILVFGGLALAAAAVLAPFALLQFAWAGSLKMLLPLGNRLKPIGGLLRVIAMGLWGVGRAAFAAALPFWPIILAVTILAGAAFLIWRFWGPISDFFTNLWNRVVEIVRAAIPMIGQAILNFSPLGLFIQAFSALWPHLQALGERFAQIGRDLIAGLIRGVISKLGELKSTITSAASSAATWFRERMGIRSPSRVFMAFGGHTMAGLALGIERARNRPLEALGGVGAAMTGALALSAGPALAGPGGGSGGGYAGDVYNITVNAPAGADTRQIADEVMRLIKAEADNRRRGGFGDDEE